MTRLFDQYGIKGALDTPTIKGLPKFTITGLSDSTPNLMAWGSCIQEKLSSNCQIFPDFLVGKLPLPEATIGEEPGAAVPRRSRAGIR